MNNNRLNARMEDVMTKQQKRVILLYQAWKALEERMEFAQIQYERAFEKLSGVEVTEELLEATQ